MRLFAIYEPKLFIRCVKHNLNLNSPHTTEFFFPRLKYYHQMNINLNQLPDFRCSQHLKGV